MSAIEDYAVLAKAGVPFVSTTQVSRLFQVGTDVANRLMGKMEDAGLVSHVKRNLWMIGNQGPLALGDYIVAPYTAYVSLFTALHLHGFIEQVPTKTYMVSMARSQQVKTTIGTISVHTITPEMYGGFEIDPYPMATPTKSLIDFLYFGATPDRQFAALPELTIHDTLDVQDAWYWVSRIPSAKIQSFVAKHLSMILDRAT